MANKQLHIIYNTQGPSLEYSAIQDRRENRTQSAASAEGNT